MATERTTVEIKDIFSPTKAAEYLGVSRMTLWRWVREGKITPILLDHTFFHIKELERVKELNKPLKKVKTLQRQKGGFKT